MAARAGARLRDLEFVQFHPTALRVETDPLPLVTEALRGAGARLVDATGAPIINPAEGDELAPRDFVARAIWSRMREGGQVFLDARTSPGEKIAERFPGAYALCSSFGINPVHDLIPVTPATHYHMGGIAVDAEGRTSVPGLWAAGEAAASGLHGANRLASNSLLEGLVFGPRAGESIARALPFLPPTEGVALSGSSRGATFLRPGKTLAPEDELRIRTILWERVGVVRDEEGLRSAVAELDAMEERLAGDTPPHARNLLLCGRLIARAALQRRESIGSHFRSDFPEPSATPCHSSLYLDPSAEGGIDASLAPV
jgi:L-aspartate oxidase